MGTHRKPRTGILESPAGRRGALGMGAAALASATWLSSQPAFADDIDDQRQRAEEATARAAEVKDRVDTLYREAGTATQHYNAAQENVTEQQALVETLLDEAERATDRVNEARRTLGSFAAAQYRSGAGSAMPSTVTFMLADDPQSYFDQRYALARLGDQQQQALSDYTDRQAEATEQREEATEALDELVVREDELQAQKEEVQGKLAEARQLLEQLTEEEQDELAELERLEREEAERVAEQERLEREAAERAAAEEAARAQEEADAAAGQGSGGSGSGSGGSDTGGTYATKAQAAIAFAEAQIGKPYVWGATGPNSYDCSGLTQAAWREAGVQIPRVTWDQVNIGTKVAKSDLQPGDLVFFYSDISHVGLYIGGGQMIHAPKPGDVVKVESIDYMPWHSAVRPA
ncbi:NlpC/P60 family protein [Streptomyces sp. XM4011]|uniref:C40 family peptidase n=1 Tax=Streptomyces sp. XM4011 TaxID=2929780 RepID=UPI001FF75BDC|nr:C40 family peptidase [Streptomyces sp. XM4011]MCK1816126.1 NlpC/P60 family protein [Streptomyces sp. XM4011]